MVANEFHFVIWMDASVRFHNSSLDATLAQARKQGVLFSSTVEPVAMRTHPATFRFLREEACTFNKAAELYATFLIIYGNRMVTQYFLKPWTSCALTLGCMLPDTAPWRYINCGHHGNVYHDCHRFDQSVLGILSYRLFFHNIKSHMIKLNYSLCKECKTWKIKNMLVLYPNNEWI